MAFIPLSLALDLVQKDKSALFAILIITANILTIAAKDVWVKEILPILQQKKDSQKEARHTK